MKTLSALLGELTYDDLDLWAGEKIRTRGKSYIGRVDGLHRTPKGELVAWVSGTEDYATLVHLDEGGEHEWFCTCPYDGGPCKHAVAVILAAAQQVKRKREIPVLSDDDDLHLVLFGEHEDEPVAEEGAVIEPPPARDRGGKREKTKLRKLLEGKSRDELLELVMRLVTDFPAVERCVVEAEQLKSGRIEPLVRLLRREIDNLTSEPAWANHWSGECDIPDYSHVRQQFATLLAAGHADALLELSDELWRRGSEQVEQSDDEGETGEAIAGCLDLALRALPRSSLSPADQLLWVIDRLLQDEFGLLHGGEKVLADESYGPEAWGQVAAVLEKRRTDEKGAGRSAMPSASFRRTELQGWLVDAYRRSGQADKIVPLLEQEVDRLGNYNQLVDTLIAVDDLERARQWCRHGFARTLKEAPGSAAGLQQRLRRIAELEHRHDLVAAHWVQEFFRHPCLEGYKAARKASEKLGCWPAVRTGLLGFLETGRRPDSTIRKEDIASWPLPEPEVCYPQEKSRGGARGSVPDRGTLIEIAIFEKRFDDVVALHRALKKGTVVSADVEHAVAKAVAKTHPDVALGIWRVLVDGLIAQVKPRAYVEAGGYLRLMRKVFETNQRLAEWDGLLAELRRGHKAKRRLLEVLDSLGDGGTKIIG